MAGRGKARQLERDGAGGAEANWGAARRGEARRPGRDGGGVDRRGAVRPENGFLFQPPEKRKQPTKSTEARTNKISCKPIGGT